MAKTKATSPPPKSLIKQRKFTQKDFIELCVLTTYMVQKLGKISLQDLLEILKKNHGATIHKNTMSKVLEALRAKNHIVANYDGSGDRVYSIADLKFNCRVEVAHVDEILPLLLDDPAGRAIKAEIEGEIKKPGIKERKFPEGMADFVVQFMLITPWHGSQPLPGNPYLLKRYQESNFNNTFDPNCDPADTPLLFERLGKEHIVIHNGCVQGLVTSHCHKFGISESAIKKWCSFEPIVHAPKSIEIAKRPIIRWENGVMQGAGFGFYETIPEGEIITWGFSGPTINFLTIKQWERFVTHMLRRPNRGPSPGRGSQTGNGKVISFRCELWDDLYKDEDEKKDEAA